MAEFALLLFPLTVFLLGTIDFCRAFYAYNVINNCARNAAVWQCDPNHPYYANLTAAAQGDASNLSTLNSVSIGPNDPVSHTETITNADGSTTQGTYKAYTVTVTYDFIMITSYLFGGTTIPMSRSVTMRVIQPAPD
jgi:Flp pilus assembly protein TadG